MGKFDSLLLYFSVYTLSAIFLTASKKERGKKIDIWFILALVGPIILATIRDNVGTDYQNYVWMYQGQSEMTFSQWFKYSGRYVDGTPFGIWLVSQVAKIFDSREVFFGLLSALILMPTFLFIKNELPKESCFLAAFVFLAGTFTSGFNITKQCVAVAFIIYGMRYAFERKKLKFLLFVLIAYCFHPSAIVAAFIYIFHEDKVLSFSLKKFLLLLMVVVFVFSITTILGRMGGRFALYAEGTDVEFNNRTFYLNLVWCVLFFFSRKKYTDINPRNDLYITLFLVGLLLTFSGFLSPYIKRIAMYYTFAKTMLLAQFPLLFSKNEKFFVAAFIFAYVSFIFIYSFYVLEQSDIIPYNYIQRSVI